MFKADTPAQPDEETIIGPSVTVEGDFGGEGNIRIEGTAKGSIKTRQNLHVAPTAKIHATIDAQNATVAGEVKGNVRVKEKLEILATARITGDIEARTITVAAGAALNGKIMVGESSALTAETPLQKHNNNTARILTK